MSDKTCGRIGLVTVNAAAIRAADRIAMAPTPRAVSIAHDGTVTVDHVDMANPAEMVGVYRPQASRLALFELIECDLMEAMKERGISGSRSHKHRVYSGKRAA